MDLFHELAPLPQERKRRVHFHEFMLGVHDELHNLQKDARIDTAFAFAPVSAAPSFPPDVLQRPQSPAAPASRWVPAWAWAGSPTPAPDPLVAVARGIARDSWLLCFDEFQVTDVADALLLRRLFQVLLDHGVVVVATSNRMPSELYQGGLNREAFLPFISLLEQRCELHVVNGERDFRRRDGGQGSLAAVDAAAVGRVPGEEGAVVESGGTFGAAVGQVLPHCSSQVKAETSALMGYHYCSHAAAADVRACARDRLRVAFDLQCAGGTTAAAGAVPNTRMSLQVRDNVRIAVSSGRHVCVERALTPPEFEFVGSGDSLRAL